MRSMRRGKLARGAQEEADGEEDREGEEKSSSVLTKQSSPRVW